MLLCLDLWGFQNANKPEHALTGETLDSIRKPEIVRANAAWALITVLLTNKVIQLRTG